MITPAMIKKHRKKLGYTQGTIGKKLYVTGDLIGQWERGTTPIPEFRNKELCELFGIPYTEKEKRREPRRIFKSEEQRKFEREQRVMVSRRMDRKSGGKWSRLADDDAYLELYRKLVGFR